MYKLLKHKHCTNLILFILFTSTIILYSKERGVVGRTQKNLKGCTCHNDSPSNELSVNISAPDTLKLGEVGEYIVNISESNMKAAGINIAASEGQLTSTSEDLKKIKDELTHTSPKTLLDGKVSFEFLYSSHSEGEKVLFASANAVNLNVKKSGDLWNYAQNKKVLIINSKK